MLIFDFGTTGRGVKKDTLGKIERHKATQKMQLPYFFEKTSQTQTKL